MNIVRKSFATALTVAVFATSAVFATTNVSQAGYYGGHYATYYGPHCYWKSVRVHNSYGGYYVKRVHVCH